MGKYFYLNQDNKWVGPYSLPRVILDVFRSRIELHTPIWSKGFSDGTSSHPLECVNKRKIAHQLSFLPIWLFPVNLKLIVKGIKKRIAKKFKKDDGMQAIMAQPLPSGKLLDNAPLKHVLPSLTLINDFNALSKFEATLIYFNKDQEATTSKYPAYIKHTPGHGFSFNIIMDEIPNVGGVLFKESYGLHRKVYLKNKATTIQVGENAVENFTTKFPYQPQQLKGDFTDLKTFTESDYDGVFQRLVVTVNDTEFIGATGVVRATGQLVCDKETFNLSDTLFGPTIRVGISYIEMQIEGCKYHIYDLKQSRILIDNQQPQNHEQFRIHTRAIRKTIGALSGKYYADEVYYLTAQDQQFKEVEGPWYVLENATVISDRRVIDTRTYENHKRDIEESFPAGNNYRSTMKIEVFETLCDKLVKEEEILRTVELVISAMGNPDPVQQGAMYSVALETITNLLGKKKEDKLNPIQDKQIFKRLLTEWKTALDGYSKEISADAMAILNIKLETANSPTNRDKLTKTFALYGIPLTAQEIKTIDQRNTYLHGKSPLDAKFVFELNEISLKLHNLILKLLLKYAGYGGHFINLAGLAFGKDEAKVHEFVKKSLEITTTGTAEMQKFSELGDQKQFEAARDKWEQSVDENTPPPIVEIIL